MKLDLGKPVDLGRGVSWASFLDSEQASLRLSLWVSLWISLEASVGVDLRASLKEADQ